MVGSVIERFILRLIYNRPKKQSYPVLDTPPDLFVHLHEKPLSVVDELKDGVRRGTSTSVFSYT